MDTTPALAIIGGSGIYQMNGLDEIQSFEMDTPYGRPSAPILTGILEGRRVAFLARHGLGHTIMPSEVNSRANLYALRALGVQRVVGINAVGSLREDYAPGDIVIPDQVFDLTHMRPRSFFSDGIVVHIGVAEPFCPYLSGFLLQATRETGVTTHSAGNLVVIEGPRFSTRLESNVYRAWGMTLVGMTTTPEVFLAREAELCYSSMAHITDYDVWHTSAEPVTVDMVVEVLNKNTIHAQQAIRNLIRILPDDRLCECGSALQSAIITRPADISPEARAGNALFLDKYLS